MCSRATTIHAVHRLSEPYALVGDLTSNLIATAIHAGHEVRPEIAALFRINDAVRLREEDPFTDRIAARVDLHLPVSRSRFEVDLNRDRDHGVYRTPDDSWGLEVWRDKPSADAIERSLATHDAFYADLGRHLDDLAAVGPFVIFDVHSYNHRRGAEGGPTAPPDENPEVNIGTGSMGPRWRPVVEALIASLRGPQADSRSLDVRENVRFQGGHLARWVHQRYPDTGCAVAIEFKKTFMDEWTGTVDFEHVDALADALRAAQEPVRASLKRVAS